MEENKKRKKAIICLIVFFILVSVFFFIKRRPSNNPSHLFAETVSSSEIRLFWEGSDSATQYNIYRTDDLKKEYLRVGFSLENEYLDKELDPATEYYYKVTQIIDFQESLPSMRASAKTTPGIPLGLRAKTADFQEELRLKIDLVWDHAIGADKYFIYRSTDESGIYEKIGEAVNENYSDINILPETTYYYVVTQITSEKESAYSNEVSATTGTSWSCGEDFEYGGKIYNTIRVGNRCWFGKSLNVVTGETHRSCQIERYCYNNDSGMCNIYGGLYNFESISCGQSGEKIQGICPLGWRIPTDSDWMMLETELGMRESEMRKYGFRGTDEGSKLAGRYDLWKNGLLRQSDSFAISGMNLLPGGYQPGFNINLFYNLSESVVLWSSTQANEDEECTFWEPAYFIREIHYNENKIKRDCSSQAGTAYVRCVREY
jgi:uncharacterized protein (TIGR02145 family)